ncbi:MAG: L-threonylcarbamoyladenylate synthase [Candidatus Liptonbacteria bacterium]|nr:L-threonylcarbamoyladenylate synthase [Candidatus Liptonbacteria bacterium]
MTKTKSPNQSVEISLKNGGVGVLSTDTIYGIVGSVLDKKAVERIYKLRRRNPIKPMIVLIGSLPDLRLFGISPDPTVKKYLKKVWPHLRRGYGGQAGKVSVILGTMNHKSRIKFKYLHRGTNALAFRLPQPMWLRRLLRKTGPLVAPSANWEGKPPAKTIREAKKYFGGKVDFYIDAGRVDSPPSRIVKIESGKVVVLRP